MSKAAVSLKPPAKPRGRLSPDRARRKPGQQVAICITGPSFKTLLPIEAILVGAGMSPANSPDGKSAVDIQSWHEQVLSQLPAYPDPEQAMSPGRFWDQLASDIFLTNIQTPIWGWSNADSVSMLDYWAAFHPSVRFVLVGSSPTQCLANLLDKTDTDSLDLAEELLAWQWRTEQMLRFYHQNTARCVWVMADDACSHPQAFIERVSDLFSADLNARAQTDWTTPSVSSNQSTSSLDSDAGVILPKVDLLQTIRFEVERDAIVSDVIALMPDVLSLHHEVLATVLPLEVATVEPSISHASLNHQSGSNSPTSTLTDEGQLPDGILARIEQYRQKRLNLQKYQLAIERQLQEAEQKHNNAMARLEQQQKQAELEKSTQAEQRLQERLKDTEEENDLLLAQLHQVQEELERYFLRAQELERIREADQARWQRLTSRHAGLCDYRSVERLKSERDDHCQVWQVTDFVDASGREVEKLRFELVRQDGFVGFGFKREDKVLRFWPITSAKDDNTHLELVAGRSEAALQKLALGLESLSASDWAFLKTLTHIMIEQYEKLAQTQNDASGDAANTQSIHPTSSPQEINAWLAGLKQFAQILQQLPPMLRFDSVSVVSQAEEGDYAHLVLSLSNVTTLRGSFSEWQFRVATVAAGNTFDANPRLEFPRHTGESVFEHWFVESSNAFGDKLEIRFAKDDSLVDLPLITSRIHDADRQLLTQLVYRLPVIMNAITAHIKESASSQANRFATQTMRDSSTLTDPNANQSVSVSPAVGRLSSTELDQWSAVVNTMRSIWHLQVKF